MGDLVPFRSDVGPREPRAGPLGAAIEVLNTNKKLALAIQEAADRFLQLEEAMSSAGDSRERSVAERVRAQDSDRMLVSMRELLNTITEYAEGVRHKLDEPSRFRGRDIQRISASDLNAQNLFQREAEMTVSMNELVASFRKMADDAERRARASGVDRLTQANLIDAAAKCHWLAGEASALCSKLGQVPAACDTCLEKCLSRQGSLLSPEMTEDGGPYHWTSAISGPDGLRWLRTTSPTRSGL
ncbi:MAG: hypothetical protein JHD07_04900 [Bradyrhizobium sp.]|uniref:hypothetical protein n=1 Tax=Bradyrhizobium sp. TaxID=376 RepID=UPI001A192F32|nr:hypothetical protein [Bradyrhizobium sp.]MBJ7402658.1 hypothetical protein [Bradyrhizobium sp.]